MTLCFIQRCQTISYAAIWNDREVQLASIYKLRDGMQFVGTRSNNPVDGGNLGAREMRPDRIRLVDQDFTTCSHAKKGSKGLWTVGLDVILYRAGTMKA